MSGHEDRQHSKYSPSQAERMALCPGSVELSANVPARPQTSYALEGTKAHTIIEHALRGGYRSAVSAHADSVLCMEDFDQEFLRAVDVMLAHVYGILDQHPDAVMWIETYVLPPSNAAPGETGGFCDVAIFVPSARWLTIIDYKHGTHVKEVEGNPQPLQYAAGFLYGEPSYVDQFDVDTVCLCICQPRAFHPMGSVREFDMTPYEVYEYLAVMDRNIRISQQPDAPLIPGDEQCYFCPANVDCPARTARALAVVNTTFKTVHDITAPNIPNPGVMTPDQIAYVCKMLPILESWMRDVKVRRDELMMEGVPVPGFKVVETYARRKWYGETVDVAKKLAALIGCDPNDVYEMKLIGVTEAQARVVDVWKSRAARGMKKQAAEEAKVAMAYLTLKQSTGNLTIVGEEDARPAVQKGADGPFKQLTAIIEPPLLGEGE